MLNTIILFLFIFGIQFKNVPISTSKIVVVVLAVWYLIFGLKKEGNHINIRISKAYIYTFVVIIALLLISIFLPLILQTNDFNVAYSVILLFAEDFIGAILVYIFMSRNGKYTFDEFADDYIAICIIQSIIILVMLLSNPFKTSVWGILATDYTDLNLRYGGIRGLGMASSVTYDLGVILSFAIMLQAYKMIKKNYTNIAIDITKIGTLCIGIALSGRTGIIGVAFAIILVGLDLVKNAKFTQIVKLLILISALIAFIIFIYVECVPINLKVPLEAYLFEKTAQFSTANNIGGRHSFGKLLDMYFYIPFSVFFLGAGYYVDPITGLYYMNTDAGYMRQILFWGIIPSMLLYSLYLWV